MKDMPTTISLVVLTLIALVASVLAVMSSRSNPQKPDRRDGATGRKFSRSILLLTWICLVGGAVVFIYRLVVIHQQWQPLQAHVDGLLLIAALLAAMILYLQGLAHVRGLSVFALPMLTMIFAWAICASSWTFEPFGAIDSVWKTFHLGSVYTGMLFFAIASIAGVMYLHVQRQLRNPSTGSSTRPFASLETVERLIIRTAAIGFSLLTIGLITGLVIVTSDPDQRLGVRWWLSPKVLLATAVWLIYAVVMNVKYTTNFRGARAAWLSIAGLVLLLATFGVATALAPSAKKPSDPESSRKLEMPNVPTSVPGANGEKSVATGDMQALASIGRVGNLIDRRSSDVAITLNSARPTSVAKPPCVARGTHSQMNKYAALRDTQHNTSDARSNAILPAFLLSLDENAEPQTLACQRRLHTSPEVM